MYKIVFDYDLYLLLLYEFQMQDFKNIYNSNSSRALTPILNLVQPDPATNNLGQEGGLR